MQYQGICQKMRTSLRTAQTSNKATTSHYVEYKLVLDQFLVDISAYLGQQIQLHWTGRIFCSSCGRQTPKSYAQGHCFKCFKSNAACDLCILKPETCHHHLGTCRDQQFAQHVCFQPHIVYLANSSALKVGITRLANIPTRWLDQGATQALPILQVGSRRLSGKVEILLANTMSDKTDWRKLLKGEAQSINLTDIKNHLYTQFQHEFSDLGKQYPHEEFCFLTQPALQFIYPVHVYPNKIHSHNLDKTPTITGILQGIKGQYLLMDTGVINMRKYSGYELIFTH